MIIATIAVYFVEQKTDEDLDGRLDQIIKRLGRLEAHLAAGHQDTQAEQVRR